MTHPLITALRASATLDNRVDHACQCGCKRGWLHSLPRSQGRHKVVTCLRCGEVEIVK